MRGRHKEQPEVLLTPEQLEEWQDGIDEEMARITDLFRQARRDCDQERAKELWETFRWLRQQERRFLAVQKELQRMADELLSKPRVRRGKTHTMQLSD